MVQRSATRTGTGVIVWFDAKAGYGFVKPDDGGPDIFVRLLTTRKAATALADGQHVTYELVTSGKPPKTEAIIRARAND